MPAKLRRQHKFSPAHRTPEGSPLPQIVSRLSIPCNHVPPVKPRHQLKSANDPIQAANSQRVTAVALESPRFWNAVCFSLEPCGKEIERFDKLKYRWWRD